MSVPFIIVLNLGTRIKGKTLEPTRRKQQETIDTKSIHGRVCENVFR
jgi:hypothetical protein